VSRAIAISVAHTPAVRTLRGLGPAHQPEAGQRHAGEADAEFPQRRAARHRLGKVFGQFIEFVVHICMFRLLVLRVVQVIKVFTFRGATI
jgi:hypothetical protein